MAKRIRTVNVWSSEILYGVDLRAMVEIKEHWLECRQVNWGINTMPYQFVSAIDRCGLEFYTRHESYQKISEIKLLKQLMRWKSLTW